jgi:hypothetical protein
MTCTKYDGSSRGAYCSSYLSDEQLVYLDTDKYNDIGQYENSLILGSVQPFIGFVSNDCKGATGQFFCGIHFPDCEESADGKVIPKPVCRSSCVNFIVTCTEDLSKPGEPDALKAIGFTLPDCNAETYNPSWDKLGLYAGPSTKDVDTEPFPESSALVTVDGVAQELKCFDRDRVEVDYCATELTCGAFIQVCYKGNAECVSPCPSPAFSTEQYNQQYIAYILPGLVALVLNAQMVTGLFAMGKQNRKHIPVLMRWLFVLGLFYGLINTLPVVILMHDLPCNCSVGSIDALNGTELCQGDNWMCTFSSLGVFLPIGILYLVAGLNINLYLMIISSRNMTMAANLMKSIAIGVPLLGVIMTFALDFDPVENPDEELASFVQCGIPSAARLAFLRFGVNIFLSKYIIW